MSEARRFYRYITPGALFLIEMTIAVVMVEGAFTLFGHQRSVAAVWTMGLLELGFAATTSVLLGSVVGAGLLLSTLHHSISWRAYCQKTAGRDYKDWLKAARCRKLFVLRDRHGCDCPVEKLSLGQVWMLVNVFWHTRTREVKAIEGAEVRNESLWDIIHMCGANLWGAGVVALMGAAWCYWRIQTSPSDPLWLGWVVFSLLFALGCGNWWLKWLTFRHNLQQATFYVGSVILTQLEAEARTGAPVLVVPLEQE